MSANTDPRIGMIIASRYMLQGLLARGRLGNVYRASRRDGGGRPVAVKLYSRALSREDDLMAELRAQLVVSARLKSPHAVRVLEAGILADGSMFVVTDLLAGYPLSRVIQGADALERADLVRWVDQIVEVLAEAHQLGLAHGDLRPSKVIISRDPETSEERLRVLGFGLTGLARAHARQDPEPGEADTSAAFVCPAVRRGAVPTPAADVYSLGALVHALLFATLPEPTGAPGPTPGRLAELEDLTYPAALGPSLSSALAADPAERRASIFELADALAGREPTRITGAPSCAPPGALHHLVALAERPTAAGRVGSSSKGVAPDEVGAPQDDLGLLEARAASQVIVADPQLHLSRVGEAIYGQQTSVGSTEAVITPTETLRPAEQAGIAEAASWPRDDAFAPTALRLASRLRRSVGAARAFEKSAARAARHVWAHRARLVDWWTHTLGTAPKLALIFVVLALTSAAVLATQAGEGGARKKALPIEPKVELLEDGLLDAVPPHVPKRAASRAPTAAAAEVIVSEPRPEVQRPEPSRARPATARAHRRARAELLLSRAKRELKAGRYRPARALFRRVLRLQPRQPEALAGLGKAALDLGHYRQAERHLSRAAAIDRRYQVLLAEALRRQGRLKRALTILRRASQRGDRAARTRLAQLERRRSVAKALWDPTQ